MTNTIHHSPGMANQLITIEKPVFPAGKMGQQKSPTWQLVCQAWAWINIKTEIISPIVEQVFQQITYQVVIRYREGISEDMRIRFQSRILTIQEVIDINFEHAYLQFNCREEHSTGIHSS